MENAGLKTTSWWSLGCHFTENGYPSLRYPNMAKVNIHEHRTRVTRFKPLKCLWLLETGFNSYHSSQSEAWLRAAEIYKCLREQRGSGMNRSRLQNQVTNMDFHVSLGDTKSGDPYGFPCITWYLQWRHQVDLIRFYFGGARRKRIRDAQESWLFLTRLGTQSLLVFGFIRPFDEVRAELVRDISRSRRFLWFFRGRKNYYLGFPGVWTDSLVWPVRSEETLSWGISRLRYCEPRKFGMWKIVITWCTSFGTRLGVQVRDFSACFNYFTKWDRTTSWYLEITSSLVFNLLEE